MRLNEINSNVPWSMPPGMGALTNLQTLSIFLVGEDIGCGVSELKYLAELRGQLCIKNLQTVKSMEDAKMAYLEHKQHLHRLELQWNPQIYVDKKNGIGEGPSKKIIIAEGVIGNLKPHPNLHELLIRGYPGSRFPDWMKDSSFAKLTTMKLYDCYGGYPDWMEDSSFSSHSVQCLPDLVKLHSLKHLHIERMNLLDIPLLPMLHEFSIRECKQLRNLGQLPLSLKIMEIRDCMSLNSCETEELPNLLELTVINCHHLDRLPAKHLPSLTKLEIKSCKKVKFPSDLTSLTSLVLEDCENDVMEMLHTLTALCHLDIKMEGCDLAKNPLPLGITHLTIGSCPRTVFPPEWLMDHKSLQSLKILKCGWITSLDWGLEKLTSLEYMEISDCNHLASLPPMGFPVSLQFLSIHSCKLLKERILFQDTDDWRMTASILWVWIDGEPFSVEDDRVRPPPYQGQPSIELNDVDTVQKANILNLQSTDSLRTLKLTWKMDTVQQAPAVDVLKSLQPHTNLQSLNINGYKGSVFPSWIEDISFSNLTHVTLEECQSCERLPPFGQLPALRELYITGMMKIRKVDHEFFGSGSGPVFPSLQKLSFCKLTHWKEWNGFEKEDREIFPRLRSLSIMRCVQLSSTPTLPLSLLEFHISDCSQVSALGLLGPNETPNASLEGARPVTRIERLTTTFCRKLEYYKEMELQLLSSLTEWTFSGLDGLGSLTLRNFTSLRKLQISSCKKFESLDCSLSSMQSLRGPEIHHSLEELAIISCPVFWFPEGETLPLLSVLTKLYLCDLQKLTTLPLKGLRMLKGLQIDNCNGFTTLPLESLEMLEELLIDNCSSLTTLKLKGLQKLKKLQIKYNLKLTTLTLEGLRMLTNLLLDFCRLTTLPLEGLEMLKKLQITRCHYLKTLKFSESGLQNYTALEEFVFKKCTELYIESMEHPPPMLNASIYECPNLETWYRTHESQLSRKKSGGQQLHPGESSGTRTI
ncbi:hypothetical protein QJS10_CPA16g00313 [Acorus calamus]|uniref:Uncharacterized protein n=1 Tax=Acorus calamus TaxID=4465 RepID=A0AAV9D2J1_ACOCL|nr:hypothetical protein QJS10_CPA16g00313 [Acorus calamus]